MRALASHCVWLAITACLGCLLCLHGFLQLQEPRYTDHTHSTADANTWPTAKLPLPPARYETRLSNRSCRGNLRIPSVEDLQTFQDIRLGRSWVFSAHYDPRTSPPVVRVIGIADLRKDSKPHFCRLWFEDDSQPDIRAVIEDIVPETHDKR